MPASMVLVRARVHGGRLVGWWQDVQAGRQAERLLENAQGIRCGNAAVWCGRLGEYICDNLLARTQLGQA